MLRTFRTKHTDQKRRNANSPFRSLLLESLERRLPLAVTIDIRDAGVIEGDAQYRFTDQFVSPVVFRAGKGHQVVVGNDEKVYLAAQESDSVKVFEGKTGQLLYELTASGGELDAPRALNFGPDGRLYVAGATSDNVLWFDVQAPGGYGVLVPSGSYGLNQPKGLTFDQDGNLYVSSTAGPGGAAGPHEVLRFNSQGMPLPSVGQSGAVFVPSGEGGLSNPNGLTFGPDGMLYVTSTFTDEIIRYDGATGHVISTFVSAGAGGLDGPNSLEFRNDGFLYVASQATKQILRYNTSTGSFLDVFATAPTGMVVAVDGFAFLPSGDLLFSAPTDNATATSMLLRFAPGYLAAFAISLSSASAAPVSVDFSTTNLVPASALAGSDYVPATGRVEFAPGETTRTILVTTLDDSTAEPTEMFMVNLSNPVGASITDASAVGTILDNDPFTKFYIVNDTTANGTYEYASTGAAIENYPLHSGNAAPRGAASTSSGTTVWVVDENKKVYVYNTNGGMIGSWTAGSLAANATPEGIATNGTDVWLVDSKSDKVFKYTGAASRTSGSQNAVSSFSLNSGNASPKDIVTDGVHLWVINDSNTDKVFKYTVAGALVGSWTITTSGAGSPTGITIDPSYVSDIWIVDSSADKVFRYTAATSRTSGSQSAASSFVLAPGNTNPQGIADPPPAGAWQRPSLELSANDGDFALGQLMDHFRSDRAARRSDRLPICTAVQSQRDQLRFVDAPAKLPTSTTILSIKTDPTTDSIDELFSTWDQNDFDSPHTLASSNRQE